MDLANKLDGAPQSMPDKRSLKMSTYALLVAAWIFSSAQFLIAGLNPDREEIGTLCGVASAILVATAFVRFRSNVEFSRQVSFILLTSLIFLLVYAAVNVIGFHQGIDFRPESNIFRVFHLLKTFMWTGAALLMTLGFYSAVNDSYQTRVELLEEHRRIGETLSENRQYQRRIEENEKRLKNVFGIALDGVIDSDEDGRIIYWNEQAEIIFGWTRLDAIGLTMSELIIPEQHQKAHDEGMRHFIKTGEGPVLNKRIEITAMRKCGEEFPVELGITPIRVSGKWQFTAFVRDISERKDALDSIRRTQSLVEKERDRLRIEREKLTKIAIGSSLDLELDGLCQMIEKESQETVSFIAGYDPGDLESFRVWSSNSHIAIPKDELFIEALSKIGSEVTSIKERQSPSIREVRLDDGKVASHLKAAIQNGFQSMRFSAITIPGRESQFFLCVLMRKVQYWSDDSQSSMLSAISLSSIAIQKSISVSELERAREGAEEGNRVKSEFLAHVSHDLRTPLTAIIGYADLLTDVEGRSPEDILWAKRILRNAVHLKQLLDDLIDLARVDAGKIPIIYEPTSIGLLANEVYELFEIQAREKLLDYTIEISPNIPELLVTDKTRIRQVLSNLVSNAVKFTSEGSIHISLDVEKDHKSERLKGDVLRMMVTDTGIGIDPDLTEKMFESFMRAKSSESTISGTGLGLAIVEKMTNLLEGTTTVDSELNRGSRFTVRFPISPSANVKTLSVEHSDGYRPAPMDPSLNVIERSKILLVDDNRENRLLFDYMIKKMGGAVEFAVNGVEAVDKIMTRFKDDPYDIILMDIQMPIMDGRTATRQLRENGVTTPIVALTAHASKSERRACLEAGCDDFLSKPVSREWLREVLIRQLEHSRNNEEKQIRDFPEIVTSTTYEEDAELLQLKRNYIESLSVHKSTLEAAFRSKDSIRIREIAHKIRGTAASYGFDKLTIVCGELEQSILSTSDVIPSESDFRVLIAEIDSVVENFQA